MFNIDRIRPMLILAVGLFGLSAIAVGGSELAVQQKHQRNIQAMKKQDTPLKPAAALQPAPVLGSKWLDADIETLQNAMSAGELTSYKLTELYLARIHKYNQVDIALNAVQTINQNALKLATELDAERQANGPRSPLHGIPVLVKDNYETSTMPTSAGSILFAEHQPKRDATLVSRLQDAGAVLLGKTTMHEFAYGITTQGSMFGSAKNPYALTRNPGGSSGGSGAAVAANFATFAMGSDTCGSIRIPAAQNNLVGLRGTQGLSSRAGIVPLSSTQDIGGPLARSVKDVAYVLDATVGFDAKDTQTAESVGQIPTSYVAALETVADARIGILRSAMQRDAADSMVAGVVEDALSQLHERANWQLVELASPAVDESLNRPFSGHFVLIHDFARDIDAYLSANPSLGFRNLQELIADGRVHSSVLASMQASAAMDKSSESTYLAELAQRSVVRQALLSLMAEHDLDALAYPTIRQIAAPIGEEQMGTNCRLSANSGLPAISVPAGFVEGVPVGLELLAPAWSEQKLLNLAYTVEQLYPQRVPPRSIP